MSNILGNNLKFVISGESHGECLIATLDNFPAGVKVDYDYINKCLSERRPKGIGETKRIEKDEYKIVSGVFNDITTGAPITIIIPNENAHSNDYDDIKFKPRPSHADFTGFKKYNGFNDYRGGGHFSGRLTACIVVAGSLCDILLKKYNINIYSHIKNIYDIYDISFDINNKQNLYKQIDILEHKYYKTIDDLEDKINNLLEKIKNQNDSVGGSIETIILNLPIGLGDPFFDNIESMISKSIFAIPAVKGVQFGIGFEFCKKLGSEVKDEWQIDELNNYYTKNNNNGGINGGISNGMPVLFLTAIKPTPSIGIQMDTVDLKNKKNDVIKINGRHDPAIVRRANIVIHCMTSIVITDLLMMRYGNDFYNLDRLN